MCGRLATRTRTRDCGRRLAKRLAQRLSRRRALLSCKEVETRLDRVPCHHRIVNCRQLQLKPFMSIANNQQSPLCRPASHANPPTYFPFALHSIFMPCPPIFFILSCYLEPKSPAHKWTCSAASFSGNFISAPRVTLSLVIAAHITLTSPLYTSTFTANLPICQSDIYSCSEAFHRLKPVVTSDCIVFLASMSLLVARYTHSMQKH